MTNTASTPPVAQSGLSAQDDTRVLQRIFTGHIVSQRAFEGTFAATVVSATDTTAVVNIDVQGTTFTFTCNYETRLTWPGVPSPRTVVIPPAGTACVVTFPPNDPTGIGWVLSFESYY